MRIILPTDRASMESIEKKMLLCLWFKYCHSFPFLGYSICYIPAHCVLNKTAILAKDPSIAIFSVRILCLSNHTMEGGVISELARAAVGLVLIPVFFLPHQSPPG